jgi:hypothetical protein
LEEPLETFSVRFTFNENSILKFTDLFGPHGGSSQSFSVGHLVKVPTDPKVDISQDVVSSDQVSFYTISKPSTKTDAVVETMNYPNHCFHSVLTTEWETLPLSSDHVTLHNYALDSSDWQSKVCFEEIIPSFDCFEDVNDPMILLEISSEEEDEEDTFDNLSIQVLLTGKIPKNKPKMLVKKRGRRPGTKTNFHRDQDPYYTQKAIPSQSIPLTIKAIDKLNISNDVYYEKQKNVTVRSLFQKMVLQHSMPAQKLNISYVTNSLFSLK